MTETAKPQERGAYFLFDVFRFLAASIVVIEHARDLLWNDYSALANPGLVLRAIYFISGFGHEAVMVFFVLSGFWISATVDRRLGNGGAFWGSYLIDRLSRLLIVIVPALLIGGALDLIGLNLVGGLLYSGDSGAASLRNAVGPNLQPHIFAGNLLFLQTLAVPTFGSNGPLWSLANEFWYYMWYPPLVVLALRKRGSAALVALLIAILWPKLIPGFTIWLLGSALYHADKRGFGRQIVGRKLVGGIIFIALGSMGASLVIARIALLPGAVSDLAVGFSFAVLLWGILLFEPSPINWLRRLAVYGSKASFSLYVSHFPMLVIAASWLTEGRRITPDLGSIGLLVGAVLFALIYGWVFAALTEARTSHLRKWANDRLLR